MAENMAGGIFADPSAHLKPDRGMEESIIMARCVGIGEWTRRRRGPHRGINYQSAWVDVSGWAVRGEGLWNAEVSQPLHL